nr:protein NRT1/ PTR FAMILY 6.4 [Ipomoea trifida]
MAEAALVLDSRPVPSLKGERRWSHFHLRQSSAVHSLGVELPVQNSWEMYIYMFDFSSHSWTELSERVCVMGISMNLVTYLVGDLHLSSSKSANVVTNFMGTLNILGLLGGFLADAKLGRYLTVAIFASIAALVLRD